MTGKFLYSKGVVAWMCGYSDAKIGKLQTEIANMDLLVVLLLALLGNIRIRTTPCEQRRNIERFRLNRVSGQIFRPVLCEGSPAYFPLFLLGNLE